MGCWSSPRTMITPASSCFSQQPFDRPAEQRVHHVAGDLGERLEDEAPLVQARVGDVQVRLADHVIAIEKQVQIDRARSPFLAALAAEGLLDGEKSCEEVFG